MENRLEEFGYLDNGISDIGESFEMGYNNGLEFMFNMLGIRELVDSWADKEKLIIETRIDELKKEIACEEEKMKCCAYGKRELFYLEELREELGRLEEEFDELY
jgi:hypothetical protein